MKGGSRIVFMGAENANIDKAEKGAETGGKR
jgi:hypothetical protein